MKNAYIREKKEKGACHNYMLFAEEFLSYLRGKKYSEKTVKSYYFPLNNFNGFMMNNGIDEVNEVTLDHLEKYRLYLLRKEYASGTVELYLRSVRKFFAFMEKNGHIFMNPAENLLVPHAERKLHFVPDVKEVIKLLATPNVTTVYGIRDRAFLETAYSSGTRIGELETLNLVDLNIREATLRVIGKGRKERMLPLGKEAVKWLTEYIETARPELQKRSGLEDALFLNCCGKRWGIQGMSKAISKYGKEADLPYPVTVHFLRRCCATHMLRNGAHPVEIQMLLGHSTFKTLSQYLRLNINDIMEMHSNSKPGR